MTRLTKLVLPAPLGPIRAWRAPGSRRKSIDVRHRAARRSSCTARGFRARRFTRSAGSSPQPLDQAEHAAAGEHDDAAPAAGRSRNTNRPGRLGKSVLRDHVERHADERAIKPPDAADDQHDQDGARALEAQQLEPDELRRLRDQRAGDAGERGRDRVDRRAGGEPPARRSRACAARSRECRSASGRTANGRCAAPPASRGTARPGNRDRRCGRYRSKSKCAEDRPHLHALQPVVAAGDRRSPCWPPRAASRRRPGSASAGSGRCVRRMTKPLREARPAAAERRRRAGR